MSVISNIDNASTALIDKLQQSFQNVNSNFLEINQLLSNAGIAYMPALITENSNIDQAFQTINDNFEKVYTLLEGNVTLIQTPIQKIIELGQVILNSVQVPQSAIESTADQQEVLASTTNNNADPLTSALNKINFEPLVVGPSYSGSSLNITQFDMPLQAIQPGYQQEVVDVGALPNDGTGDPLRTAFQKINNNFTVLFNTSTNLAEAYTDNADPNQIIFSVPANVFTQGQFQINSSKSSSSDSQNILLKINVNNSTNDVQWTGYGLTVFGNLVSRFDVVLDSGNVNILSSPTTSSLVSHLLAYQINYIETSFAELEIALDGYSSGTVMGTEEDLILTTE